VSKEFRTALHSSGLRREASQFYETTIVDSVMGQLVPINIGMVPTRSVRAERRGEVDTPGGLTSIVGLEQPCGEFVLPDLQAVTTAVALMLDPELHRSDTSAAVWASFGRDLEGSESGDRPAFIAPPWWADGGDSALVVAEKLVFQTPVPFESSPLSGKALSSIVSGSGGGALVLAVVDGAGSPWLLVAVAAGIVVLKVANATGDALSDVVRHRILRWLEPELLNDGPGGDTV
jgi:hypothetical protein